MAPVRKPWQGLRNIVRFNWHFYALALGLAGVLSLLLAWGPALLSPYAAGGLVLVLAPLVVSLAVSAYVYDGAGLYELGWLPMGVGPVAGQILLTVSAGFDEVSPVLRQRWPDGQLLAVDFYDPARHTEVSIGRARRAYPPPADALPASTLALPLPDHAADATLAFLAAHEIRDATERATFFREIRRVTRPGGPIVVVEHLRDPANFLAYTVGFFHFHSRRAWLATFRAAGLRVARELKITPFISAFILHSDAASA
ncbi:methyltransferase domain-containing protein [Hymenobacter sp. BRD128]|uniref:class I SAM-dependent methyltransferase n=1 Tax=Hymenobacter sp. BRD128 TaxID=2675878 RepID=UPI00156764E0|nr:class I SAM-dependent methyltransferase [Hymenobacter sp. BRD128]QKG56732.1 methyltransferase domain-containing protein [Hymenobacter sp. BRD128]